MEVTSTLQADLDALYAKYKTSLVAQCYIDADGTVGFYMDAPGEENPSVHDVLVLIGSLERLKEDVLVLLRKMTLQQSTDPTENVPTDPLEIN